MNKWYIFYDKDTGDIKEYATGSAVTFSKMYPYIEIQVDFGRPYLQGKRINLQTLEIEEDILP